MTDPRVESLTKREVELLHHVFLGRRTAEIAQIEGIAQQTVLNRLQEARGKLGGVDRRTAALIVAAAKGWTPGIKPTPSKTTLPTDAASRSFESVSQGDWQADQSIIERQTDLHLEGNVFVQLDPSEGPVPAPKRRHEHDLLTRVSALLLQTALLLAATVALLWVYGRV